ncbi:hypothetical protein [Serratia proteamaculans]
MREIDDSNDFELVLKNTDNNYNVVLPCEPNLFGRFISSLLGKPQTIEKFIPGSFSINQNDVINTHTLITQRINHQNNASLIQFTANIFYDDKSSVMVNSIEDFTRYNEIKRVTCQSLELSWTYLIQFKNKNTPEKQEINISFNAGHISEKYFSPSFVGHYLNYSHGISFMINHTERTWGVDIESLLNNNLQNYIQVISNSRKFIYRHHDRIGIMTGSVIVTGTLLGCYIAAVDFAGKYNEKIKSIVSSEKSEGLINSRKIDFLIDIISSGAWPRFTLSLVVFFAFALVASVAFAALISVKGESKLQSWILLTEESKLKEKSYKENLRNSTMIFFGSVILSLAIGIIGNVIYAKYFASLL